MDNLEENNKKKSLPYFTTKDNVTKLIEATKLKEGAEEPIKSFFGRGKYQDTKRTLQFFNVISEDMRLTDIGRIIAYSSEEKAEWEWFKIVMNYSPYEEFIQSFRIDKKKINDIIELEEIKKFWGLRDYGSSDNNRNDALTTFAYFIVMAGIGEFKIGRQKNPSRIIISRNKLEEKIKLLSDSNKDVPNFYDNENCQEYDNKKQNENEANEETKETEALGKTKSDEYYTINIPTESGAAKIYIPKDTTKEDAELIKDMINVILKRKFGI